MKKNLSYFFWYSLIIVTISTFFILTACSTSPSTGPTNTPVSTPTPNPNTPTGSSAAISLANFAFSPASITVKAGTKVTWTNKDSTTHTVTSDSGVFNSGNLPPNSSFSFTFSTPGTFSYHCSIHTYMTGTVMVQ